MKIWQFSPCSPDLNFHVFFTGVLLGGAEFSLQPSLGVIKQGFTLLWGSQLLPDVGILHLNATHSTLQFLHTVLVEGQVLGYFIVYMYDVHLLRNLFFLDTFSDSD